MKTFVVPIEGLITPRRFNVGPVTFYPSSDDLTFIDTTNQTSDYSTLIARPADQYRAVAVVENESIELALAIIEQAIHVFRVFQYGLMQVAHYTHFGLPGDIHQRNIVFYHQEDTRSGYGFKSVGLHLGFELQHAGIDSWEQHAAPLQLAASAIGSDTATNGAKRALRGVELFAQSILVRDPDLRVLLVMASLDGMLKPDNKMSRTLILAKKLTYMSCWKTGGCGHFNGQPCPYVLFNPDLEEDRELLIKLRTISRTDTRWLCTYWAGVIEWYETRSGMAHGNPEGTDPNEASAFAYWSYHKYVNPTLVWLMEHSDNPITDLDAALRSLEAQGAVGIDWHEVVRTGAMPDIS